MQEHPHAHIHEDGLVFASLWRFVKGHDDRYHVLHTHTHTHTQCSMHGRGREQSQRVRDKAQAFMDKGLQNDNDDNNVDVSLVWNGRKCIENSFSYLVIVLQLLQQATLEVLKLRDVPVQFLHRLQQLIFLSNKLRLLLERLSSLLLCLFHLELEVLRAALQSFELECRRRRHTRTQTE